MQHDPASWSDVKKKIPQDDIRHEYGTLGAKLEEEKTKQFLTTAIINNKKKNKKLIFFHRHTPI
jgi:hypothetical protein